MTLPVRPSVLVRVGLAVLRRLRDDPHFGDCVGILFTVKRNGNPMWRTRELWHEIVDILQIAETQYRSEPTVARDEHFAQRVMQYSKQLKANELRDCGDPETPAPQPPIDESIW